MSNWSKTDHAVMDIHPRNRLPHNHHTNQKMVERFCDELTAHDPWMWREVCNRIRSEIDYSEPVLVVSTLDAADTLLTYTISATLTSGQSIEMHRGEGGWHIAYGKPQARERS